MREILGLSLITVVVMTFGFFVGRLMVSSHKNVTTRKRPRKKRKSTAIKKARKHTLSFIQRSPSKTIEDLVRETGRSRSAIISHTNYLNKAKKIVILKSGRKHLFVLPSEGQNVFKHKIK